MESLFKAHIEQKFPFLQEKKILLAISGGLDSVALAHLFKKCGLDFALAHVNFQLRGAESDADATFVAQLGAKMNVPYYSTSFETTKYSAQHGISIQMAARELRYQWFEKLLEKEGYDYLSTAHHLDDQLETFLINLSRGTGIQGLTGIPESKSSIIRPLLVFDRQAIASYANSNGILWREDASNASTKYLRNKIRHKIIPLLKEENPNLLSGFSNTLAHLKETESIKNTSVETLRKRLFILKDGGIKIPITKLQETANYKDYLYPLFSVYGFQDGEDIYGLLTAQSGKLLLSSSHRLIKDREYLLLHTLEKTIDNDAPILIEDMSILRKFPMGALQFQEALKPIFDHNSNRVFIDKNLVDFPLKLRKWRKGDAFIPLGMKGRQKISDFLINSKASILEKEKTWLLCTANDTIIWVIGKRLDNRFKITTNTNTLLEISLEPSDN